MKSPFINLWVKAAEVSAQHVGMCEKPSESDMQSKSCTLQYNSFKTKTQARKVYWMNMDLWYRATSRLGFCIYLPPGRLPNAQSLDTQLPLWAPLQVLLLYNCKQPLKDKTSPVNQSELRKKELNRYQAQRVSNVTISDLFLIG